MNDKNFNPSTLTQSSVEVQADINDADFVILWSLLRICLFDVINVYTKFSSTTFRHIDADFLLEFCFNLPLYIAGFFKIGSKVSMLIKIRQVLDLVVVEILGVSKRTLTNFLMCQFTFRDSSLGFGI